MLVTVKYKLRTRVSAGEAGVTADSGGGWTVMGGRGPGSGGRVRRLEFWSGRMPAP